MCPVPPAVNQTPCHVRHVRWSFPALPCPRCGRGAPRTDEVARIAIDIDLEAPVLLQISVSRHRCAACRRYFRAQPPFLRPDAVYTNRVVSKAVQAVREDGMAMRRVPARLARDFWVRPSEASIRCWCRAAGAAAAFASDYQPWVVQEFSGILCVDEVYQGRLALLLAVDPAGDRLVGYQLIAGTVGQAEVAAFLTRLAALGLRPDEVVTDGSALYPTVLARVWPAAAHQLCLFHETRRVTAAVQQLYRAVRSTVPRPPVAWTRERDPDAPAEGRPPGLRGRPRKQPPAPESRTPQDQQWRQRHLLRQAGIAQVHALHHSGLSRRAIARATGVARATVDAWLAEPAPALDGPVAAQVPGRPLPVLAAPPPPAPWASWEEVRQVRETLTASRFLLLRRPDHLTPEEQARLDGLLAGPIGAALRVGRSFLADWYGFWRDERGQRRPREEAHARYQAWRSSPAYLAVPTLAAVIAAIDAPRFAQVSHFLRRPHWEATNNAAERTGRAFRHLQGPHFNLRTSPSIEEALAAHALAQRAAMGAPSAAQPARCARGRPAGRPSLPAAA